MENMEAKIRVMLVDDHPILRRGLQMIIKAQKDMDVVGEAGLVEEAVRKAHELLPDVIIVDLSLPDRSGIELIREIKACLPQLKILVLTIHEDENYIRSVLSEGGNGYLLKKAVDEELILAIRAVARGEMVLDPSLTRDLLSAVIGGRGKEGKHDRDDSKLSSRQKEILSMIAQGYTDRQISEKVHISVKTVESHKARIKEKLNIVHRSELVQYANKHDLCAKRYL
jgi:two-component system, NarL family, response regulator NreC